MNNIIIRQATYEDILTISKIENICFNELEAATYQEFEERFKTFSEWFLVAEYQHQVIGFINGGSTNDDILKDELYHDTSLHIKNGIHQCVFGLDVLPQYRHNGVGGLLLNEYINLAKKHQKQAVILTCKDHLIHYYQSFGFKHLGPSLSTHGNASWNDMILYFR
ncbi:MAG: GNAT family N-acetyltransferase [Erysipelotrichaceae bacterium]|nr:GNAT family N-acetyltransferase [Erysipelotrichaceae bacterium]